MKTKKHKRQTCFVSILTVYAPSADALLDMLRYDTCCPATEQESAKIERMINGRAVDALDRVVKLRRYSSSGQPATEGRWRSYGCRVLDERSPDEPALTVGELLNLAKVKQ